MKSILLFPILVLFLNFGFAQDYVGSSKCGSCHGVADITSTGYNIYDEWSNTGHPYKFSVIENNQPPEYPIIVTNFQDTWMDSLGDGSHTWTDIAGVIGGYGWKSRFVGTDGHLIGTAGSSFEDAGVGHNQFNFYGGEAHGWGNYHPGDVKTYNYGCFKCHTTGGTTDSTWLEGIEGLGNFTEGGIGCESCHGPGGDHASAPSTANIDRVYEFAHLDNSSGGLEIDGIVIIPDAEGDDVNFLCGTCHNRDYTDPINSSGGFIRHHEQWDEFVATKHFEENYTCVTCHDPHKRSIWDGDGIKADCESCHTDEVAAINHTGTKECIDCHMPFAAKSGTTRGQSGFKADVRSHLFSITVDTASMFNASGSAVRDDETRSASLSPAFTCLGCHNDDSADAIPDKTLEQAVASAADMHVPVGIQTAENIIPTRYVLQQNYPNPFNSSTIIEYTIPELTHVRLAVYNLLGKEVAVLLDGMKSPGVHRAFFDASDLSSGIYLYKLESINQVFVKKMMVIK